jgi:predicted amidohydrolase YtcJ
MVKAYREMALANELPVRIKVYVSDPLEWVDEQWRKGAQSIIDNHEDYRVGNWLRADGVKFVLDGSAGGQTLIMVEPYEGTTDQHGGPWRNDPEEFAKKLLEYDARGLTVKAHAVGSQTIRTVLDAMEAVRARGSKQRHSVAHTVFVHPDDRDRFKTLDVIAEFSPYFWYPTPSWDMLRHELGERRLEWVFPFKTFTDMGVKVSVGSDWPVVDSPNPFPAIETMISRQLPGGSEVTGPGAAQRVSLQTAIHALTMGGAYAQGREHLIGSLEAGKLADFIVLDQNLFEIDVQAIHKTRVLKTVVDGRTVFER